MTIANGKIFLRGIIRARDNNDAAKKKLNLWTLSAKREFLVF
jgi:hypothetical protein